MGKVYRETPIIEGETIETPDENKQSYFPDKHHIVNNDDTFMTTINNDLVIDSKTKYQDPDFNAVKNKYKDPNQLIKTEQVWCEFGNSQMGIASNGKGNIKKILDNNKNHSSDILEIIYERFNNGSFFTSNQILLALNIKDVSNGQLQRNILDSLVCKGILKKSVKSVKKKSIVRRPVFLYKLKSKVLELDKPCPYYQNGKCNFDFKLLGKRTDYFDRYEEVEVSEQ